MNTSAFRDVDKISLPLGGIGGGTELAFKLRLGHTQAYGTDADDPFIDILATGLSQRGDAAGVSGIMTPSNLRYWRWQHYFRSNPGLLKEIQIQASDEAALMGSRLLVRRDSPWAPFQAEEYALSSFIRPENLQRNNVIIPCDTEFDGITFLRLHHQLFGDSTTPDDKFLTMTLRFEKIAELRRSVSAGG
jgi:hypothetical protein